MKFNFHTSAPRGYANSCTCTGHTNVWTGNGKWFNYMILSINDVDTNLCLKFM